MRYFNTLPLVYQKDLNNNNILVNNILTRCYFLPQLLQSYSLFYEYEIKEGDSPENIAHRYYDDIYRYWLVLYSNNIIDPKSQWPLTSREFDLYLTDKYKDVGGEDVIAYTLSTIHHYEKTIYTSDSTSLQEQSVTIWIDEQSYNSLLEEEIDRVVSGITYRKRITKNAISIYNYELSLNESKRKINLLKKDYSSDAEKQFQKLMGQ